MEASASHALSFPLLSALILWLSSSPGSGQKAPETVQKMFPCPSSPIAVGKESPTSLQGKETPQEPSKAQLWVWKARAELGLGSGVSVSG